MKPITIRASLAFLLAALLAPRTALAYIDPNTGGMIFQILAPLLAMLTSGWLFFKDRISAIFNRIKRVRTSREARPTESSEGS